MRILTTEECEDFAHRSGVSLSGNNVSLIAGRTPASATVKIPSPSRHQAIVANRIFGLCDESRQWLIWILEWGVWSTEEYPEIWMQLRARHGDERLLYKAPGQLLSAAEGELARGLFRLAILFGWDALLIPDPPTVVAFVSHDECIDLYSTDAAMLNALVVDLAATSQPGDGDGSQ
jgi:hypothetical protein